MKYLVGIKIYNCFEVEADSDEEAEMQVRGMDVYKTLDDCDFNIAYIDKLEERYIPQEMCQDLLDRIGKKNQ